MGSGETGGGDTGSEGETPEPIIRSDNELAKLALLPFIVDKVFAGEALDGDLTGFLSRVYPTAGAGTLKTLGKRNPLFRQLEAQIRLCGGAAET